MKMTKKVFSFKFVFNILNRNFSIFIVFAIAIALRFISSIACFLVANSTRLSAQVLKAYVTQVTHASVI